MINLEDYRLVAGPEIVQEISILAERLRGKSILHVNSTAVGGGVAEILNRMVPLLNGLGISTRWDVIKGGDAFYAATKKFHNALHGTPQDITPEDFRVYEETVEENATQLDLNADFVFIHDPQPAALVKRRNQFKNHWLWRCHIDLSHAAPQVWNYLKPLISSYDACVISDPRFSQKLAIPQTLIAPSIDPLSDKNRELTEAEINEVFERLKIPRDKPLITQVSRFDRLKDPLGVIEAFKALGPNCGARLLLVGGSADDDPEGAVVYREVMEKSYGDANILVLSLPPTSHIEINAIQRGSAIIMQKSLREGFGLTVSEALWKSKPVIAGSVGGIPQQIIHKHSGILVHSIEGASYWMRQLLREPEFARRLGENGREHVRNNFLLTRHLRDYLLLFLMSENLGTDFIRL
jgi:trehalose synthase